MTAKRLSKRNTKRCKELLRPIPPVKNVDHPTRQLWSYQLEAKIDSMLPAEAVSRGKEQQKDNIHMSIWEPSDNKFATEYDIKIEACNSQLSKLKHDAALLSDRIDQLKFTVFTLSKVISFLRQKATIVSLTEFCKIKVEKLHALHEIKTAYARSEITEFGIASLNKEIERLTLMKESVRFKVINIRGDK
jgi:hypothetical protein